MKKTISAVVLSAGLILAGPLGAQQVPKEQADSKPEQASDTKPLPAKKPDVPAGEGVERGTRDLPEAAVPENEPEKPTMDPEKMETLSSYGFGYRNGRNFASQTGRYGLTMDDLDRERFLKGFFDALEFKDSEFDQEEINEALNQLSMVIRQREKKIAEENKKVGMEFLAENRKREGVITTETGLQYEILEKGDGEVYSDPPQGQRPNKQFMTKYRGTLIDGTEFDSSEGEVRPMSLNVIPGFKEALTMMPVGSKWKLYIPPHLGYKETRRSAQLGPNSTLIFELELTEIKDVPQRNPLARPGAATPPARVPGGRTVSPPVRVPPQGAKKPTRAVSPPVRIPTNPDSVPKGPPSPNGEEAEKAPAESPEAESDRPDPSSVEESKPE